MNVHMFNSLCLVAEGDDPDRDAPSRGYPYDHDHQMWNFLYHLIHQGLPLCKKNPERGALMDVLWYRLSFEGWGRIGLHFHHHCRSPFPAVISRYGDTKFRWNVLTMYQTARHHEGNRLRLLHRIHAVLPLDLASLVNDYLGFPFACHKWWLFWANVRAQRERVDPGPLWCPE